MKGIQITRSKGHFTFEFTAITLPVALGACGPLWNETVAGPTRICSEH